MAVKKNSAQQLEQNKLIKYFQNGQHDDAKRLAEKITKKFPDNQIAWKILGAIFTEIGQMKKALIAANHAVRINPEDAEANHNLGIILRSLGRIQDSEKSFRNAILIKPNFFEAYINLGISLEEMNNLEGAELAYNRAIELKPDFAISHNNLANTLQDQERYEEAIVSFKEAIRLKADFFQAYNNLGTVYFKLSNLEKAESNYRSAISIMPDFAEAYHNLGKTCQELGKYDEALDNFNRAISIKPDYANSYFNLAITLYKLHRPLEAEDNYRKAINIKDNFYQAHNNLGLILINSGKFSEAESCFKKAINFKSNFAEAHRNLSSVKKFKYRDEHFNLMSKLLLDKKSSNEELCHINFALAKASEDLNEFELAFDYYKKGNLLRKKIIKYDIKKDVDFFNQLKNNFLKIRNFSLNNSNLSTKNLPIFIVGMPRSGTTLVEQIISSHSKVTGGGELPFAGYFGIDIVQGLLKLDSESLLNFRKNYLLQLETIFADSPLVTDKMPHNFRFIGLIAATLPEAKIIHVKRNPAATCWANYKTYFEAEALGYCFSLDDTVRYYKLYRDLMSFWSDSLPGRIYDLDYELLSVNQENETKKLISFLDLDWESSCLSPESNNNVIDTASSIQARKKVYQGSSHDWEKYKKFLDGKFDQLINLD